MNFEAVRWMRGELRRAGYELPVSMLAARYELAAKVFRPGAEHWAALEEAAWMAIRLERNAPAVAAKLAAYRAARA